MNVIPNTFWRPVKGTPFTGKGMCHKVIDVEFQDETKEHWITTWSVVKPSPADELIIPDDYRYCWSWFGPIEEFLNQFQPVQSHV